MASRYSNDIACVIDTDIAIDFLCGREYAKDILDYWSRQGLLAVSALTQLEIFHGMKSGEMVATNSFLDGIISIEVDLPLIRQANIMLGEISLKGNRPGLADAMIAASALKIDAPLLTNNVKYCQFPHLKVINCM